MQEEILNKNNFESGKIGSKFISSLRRGRYSIKTTLGDLIDNSQDAGASKIWVDTEGPTKKIEKIIVADDGCGMDEQVLKGSYTLGYNRERKETELGKFGVGGTLGSLGVAGHKLTITRSKSKETFARQYCIKKIIQNDEWGTEPVMVEPWMENLLNSYVGANNSGTVIILSNFDLDNFGRRKDNFTNSIANYLSGTYSEFVATETLEIKINGKLIESQDPLCWWRPEVTKLVDMVIPGTNTRIRAVDLGNITTGVPSKFSGSRSKNQGGYIFRCKRLIQRRITSSNELWGNKLPPAHSQHSDLRWAIYYDAGEDELYGTSFDKSEILPKQSVMDKISEIVKPAASKVFARKVRSENALSEEEKQKRNEAINKIVTKISKTKKDKVDVSMNNKGEVKITENEVIPLHPDPNPVKIPKYIIKDASMGQGSEVAHWVVNPDPLESEWILQINTDHRYINKYYLNQSQSMQNAVISWIVPLYLSLHMQLEEQECNILDFRDLLNRKVKQIVSELDMS